LEHTGLFTSHAGDLRRHARALTRGIIIVGSLIILAMWAVVIASIFAEREAAIDRARSEGRNLAIAFADEVNRVLDGVAGGMEIIADRTWPIRYPYLGP
jgi:hypothetical protein